MNTPNTSAAPARSQLTPGRWTVDPQRSTATFTARGFWGAVPVKGRFSDLSGTGTLGQDGTFDGTLIIPVSTLKTGIAFRDKHLLSADFFAADQSPEIRFSAHALTTSGAELQLRGTLTVREHSLELALPVEVQERDGGIALTAQTSLDRAALGVGHSPLGMIRGASTVHVDILLRHEA